MPCALTTLKQEPNKIKVGGLKILEGGACVVASFPQDKGSLAARVGAPLARNRINLSFFAHVEADRKVLCTAAPSGEEAATLLKTQSGPAVSVQLHPSVAILSLYPHDKQPEIIGSFIRSLAQARVIIHGLASSLSAISAVLSSGRTKVVVRRLFENFHFPAFESPEDFFAVQSPPEELVRRVVATYQEKVIQVYWIVPQADLDLWSVTVSSRDILAGFANALADLAALGLKIPFLAALPGLEGREFLISFSTSGLPGRGAGIRRVLSKNLPGLRPMRLTPVAGIFLHGPHFGDRYGIAHALTEALEQAHIPLLALSCTISSISLIIRQNQLAAAQLVLGRTFAAPVANPAGGGPP